tara:strand:+ start:4559 stop:5776 length:1218 start_codon:yes stop_codon:yes gene_type:complete
MSVYSVGNVKTKMLEPSTYNENISCEWRLTEPCLPSIRLVDVGCKSQQNTQYNKLLGAYAVIRSIHLYSGQTLLDGTPNIGNWMAFKKYNKTNTTNRNLARLLVRNQGGYKLNHRGYMTDEPVENNQAGTTDATTTAGFLPLNEYLPLLDKLNVLDPAVFKNLRLVVEFEPDRTTFLNTGNATSHNTRRPRLIYDAVAPGSFNANPPVIQWNAIEQDRFISPVFVKNAITSKRVDTAKLNGFNNKMIGRLVMCKAFQNTSLNVVGGAVQGYGAYSSHAQHQEVVQVVVNGVQQLPRNGVEGGNRMLSMLHDTWGACNTLPGGANLGIVNDNPKMVAQLRLYQGQQSYFGMFVNQRVKDMQIQLTRTGLIDNTARTPTNEALNCLVYAEVSKSLILKGGEVNIVYN